MMVPKTGFVPFFSYVIIRMNCLNRKKLATQVFIYQIFVKLVHTSSFRGRKSRPNGPLDR